MRPLVAPLLGLVLLLAACETDRDRAFHAHFEGIALAQRGSTAEAIGKFEQAIALSPRLDASHRELTRIHLSDRHYLRALGSADAAIAIRENVAGHHERRGDALVGLERWDDAQAAYERALAIDVERQVIHFKMGRLEESRGDVAEAIAAYRRHFAADPHATAPRLAIARLAITRDGTGDLELAQTMITEARGEIPEGEAGAEQRAYLVRLDARREQRVTARVNAERATAREQALALALAQQSGILGALARMDGRGINSAWAPGAALGNGPTTGLGSLMGDRIGESFGFGGLDVRGTGLGAGGGGTGEGTIGLGNIGTIGIGGGGSGSGYGRGAGGMGSLGRSAPTVRLVTRVTSGPIIPEVATRIVRRNVNQARYCYEVELARSPALAGNTTFALVVAPTGSVTGVTTSSSTLGNATAESCIQRALQRLTFTSGATESRLAVTFTFQPATATPPAAAAPPAAPAP